MAAPVVNIGADLLEVLGQGREVSRSADPGLSGERIVTVTALTEIPQGRSSKFPTLVALSG